MNPFNLLLFLLTLVACLTLMPIFIRLARTWGLVDNPGHRKIHERPVPKAGGMTILASILLVAMGTLAFGGRSLGPEREMKIVLVLGTTLLAGLLGLLDDLYDLRPRLKLSVQALIFTFFAIFGFHFQVLHIPGTASFDLHGLAIPLTILWIMAVVNGFNFMDGVDGLAGSVTAVILAGIGIATRINHGPEYVGVLWICALAAVLAFLTFNWGPAKVYLGDTGSNALGALVALALTAMGSAGPAFMPPRLPLSPIPTEAFRFQVFTVSLLAGYPLLEVTLTTLRRVFKRLVLGRSIESSEMGHIHHRFLKAGFGSHGVCGIAMAFQLVLTVAGLLVMVKQNALATWILAPFFMFLAYLAPRSGLLDFLRLRQLRAKPHYVIAHNFISIQRAKMGLARNREEILALVSQTCREFGVRCYRFRVLDNPGGKGGIDYFYQNEELIRSSTMGRGAALEPKLREGEFYDYYEMPGSKCEAFWVFESNHRHDELDVEYRVLVSGFMREALETCVHMEGGETTLTADTTSRLPHHKTSGHHLHKRHRSLFKDPDKARLN